MVSVLNLKQMDILVDFDGTVVTHDYPLVGKEIGAAPVLKELIVNGHRLILFTMRCDKQLQDAVEWFKSHGIELFGIQINPEQKAWTSSPKAYGQLIIDDICLGIPLVKGPHSRPYVDWEAVRELLLDRGIINRF